MCMDKKAIVSITQKVKDWKKLFIERACLENPEGLTEETSWVDIMKRISLNPYELLNLTATAVSEFGFFNIEEQLLLSKLPWYNAVVELLPQIDTNMLGGTQFHIGAGMNAYNVCFIYHKESLDIFECFIIAPEIAEIMETDMLISYFDAGKVACVSFVKEIPAHFNVM